MPRTNAPIRACSCGSFWGSDITRVPETCSYRQVVTHFTEELDFLSAGDLEWIMGRGLATCLRWPEPRT